MPALRKKREHRLEREHLQHLRKIQRKKRYEPLADIPADWALDVVRRLQSDDERRDAADELRGQANHADEAELRERLSGVADAIDAICTSSDYLPEDEASWPMWIPENAKAWAEAECRYDLIVNQIKAVCPQGVLTDAGAWILEGNINNLTFKTDATLADRMLLGLLKTCEDNIYNPVEYHKYKRNGVNPWEVDSGYKAKTTGRSNDDISDHLDHTKAGKKKRAKAWETVRRLDPTNAPPISPVIERGNAHADGWERFGDGDRIVPADQEGRARRLKAEARRINDYARQARRERKIGIGKK